LFVLTDRSDDELLMKKMKKMKTMTPTILILPLHITSEMPSSPRRTHQNTTQSEQQLDSFRQSTAASRGSVVG